MSTFAQASDVADLVNADTMIEYVEAMIRRRIPDIDARLAAGTIDPLLLQLATIQPVRRVLMNVEGARTRSETTGPFSESITLDSAISTGALYLTDADLSEILPSPASLRVGTVRLRAGLGSP